MSLPPIATRKLGRAKVSVSELGLGTAPLGDLFDKLEDDEASAVVEDGVGRRGALFRHFALVRARAVRASPRPGALSQARENFVLSTKIGRVLRRPLKPGPIKDQWVGGLEFETVYDYGYDGVMRSFEDSLQRLGISSIDLLLVHDLDIWNRKNPERLDAYFAQLIAGGWRALKSCATPARSRASAPG